MKNSISAEKETSELSQLILPPLSRVLVLVFIEVFALSAVNPSIKYSVFRNEVVAFAGTVGMLWYLLWWLKDSGIGISALLLESAKSGYAARALPVLKFYALYFVCLGAAGYMAYGGVALAEWLTAGKLVKLSSFQAWAHSRDLGYWQHISELCRPAPIWWGFFFAGIAPVFEELFFRRFLYVSLRRRHGFKFSVIVTSVLFGLMHATSVYVVLSTIFLGLFLGYLYEKQRDYGAVVGFHMLNNMLWLFC